MKELLLALAAYVSALTGLPPAPDVPRVVFETPAEIRARACPAQTLKDIAKQQKCSVMAGYLTKRNLIILPTTWNASNLEDVGVLLHEVCHHLQFNAGLRKEPGSATIESMCYGVQAAFLRPTRLGIDKLGVPGL